MSREVNITKNGNRLQFTSVVLVSLVIVVAILVLIGWTFDIKSFRQPIQLAAAMNPFTAVCFILQGSGFILLTRFKKINTLKLAGTIVVVICFLLAISILGGIIFGSDIRIDTWLFYDKMDTGVKGFSLNYMAPNTALNFVMLSVAYLPLIKEEWKKWIPSEFLATVVGFIAMLTLLGYIYHIEEFYKVLNYFPMAVHTSIGFLFIVPVILFTNNDKGVMQVFSGYCFGSIMARKLLPSALFLPIILGLIRIKLERQEIIVGEMGVGFLVLSNMVIFILIILITAHELNKKEDQRKEAEHKTNVIAKRLELAAKTGRIGVWEWDIPNNELFCDSQLHALYGLTNNTFGKTFDSWKEFVHPEDVERIHAEFLAVINGEKDFASEYRVVWPDSSIKTIKGRAKIERNKKGEALRMIGINWDISEQIKAEEDLRENNLFLDTIFENIPNMLFVKDAKDLSFIRFNRAAERLLGHKVSGFIGKNDYDFFPKEQADFFVKGDRDVIEKGKLLERKEEINTAHGKRWLHTKKIPLYNKNGLPLFILGISEDITERKLLEDEIKQFNLELEQKVKVRTQELIESEKRLQSLFENAPESIFVLNVTSLLFVRANKNAIKLLKLSLEEVIVKGFIDISPEFQPDGSLSEERAKLYIEKALQGERISFEWMVCDANKKNILCEVHLVLLPETKNPRIYISVVDITEKSEIREKLKEQYIEIEKRVNELDITNQELKKTNNELDRFVYSASHDLRSPLKSMLGLSDLIKDDMDQNDVFQLQQIDMMKRSIIKLDNFIEDILQYSHNARRVVIQEPVYFNEIIQDITDRHIYMDEGKQMKMEANIQQDIKFVSDKRRLHVVFNHLISNAIKYRDSSKRNTYVKIDVKCNKDNAIISVKDNGIGIEEQHKEKIFEMFYRATKVSTGSGLGLYVLKEALNMINGSIKVESKFSIGTTFYLTIPNQFAIQ